MNNIRPYRGIRPQLGEHAYIDPAAVVIGDVQIGADSSVWPCAVLRGDVNHIRIGARTSIQDGSILHVTHKNEGLPEGYPLIIGDDVTVGHQVTLHGCCLGDRILVGIGACILDNAVVESDVMIGAGTLVPPGKLLQSGYLYLGSPAKQVRRLSDAEIERLVYSAHHYVKIKNHYLYPDAYD